MFVLSLRIAPFIPQKFSSSKKSSTPLKILLITKKPTNVVLIPAAKKMIRDVHCRKCQVKLGWFNEFIEDTNQQYKEGRSSLFSKSIACRNGIESEKCEATLNFE